MPVGPRVRLFEVGRQLGMAGDLMNPLGFALGDEGAERIAGGGACRRSVHGWFLFFESSKRP